MIKYKKIQKPTTESKFYFTSDTHAFHKNITRGTSLWGSDSKTRDYEDEIKMTEAVAQSINEIVGVDDVLFHCGDWSFGGEDKIRTFREMINCKNVYLIMGNHDFHIYKDKNKYKDLFIDIQDVMYINADNVSIFLSHYPHYVWHQHHHGVIHLFGHTHGSINGHTDGKMLDVGWDVYHRPISLEEVVDYMKNIPIQSNLSHHNERTN